MVAVLPAEAGFIVIGRNPLLDGLPGRLDGLEALDVERGFGRWRNIQESFPEAHQAQEELNFFGLNEGFDFPHGAFATGALEGIGSPGGEDEVAPKGPHGRGARGGRWDEERIRFRRWYLLLIFGG